MVVVVLMEMVSELFMFVDIASYFYARTIACYCMLHNSLMHIKVEEEVKGGMVEALAGNHLVEMATGTRMLVGVEVKALAAEEDTKMVEEAEGDTKLEGEAEEEIKMGEVGEDIKMAVVGEGIRTEEVVEEILRMEAGVGIIMREVEDFKMEAATRVVPEMLVGEGTNQEVVALKIQEMGFRANKEEKQGEDLPMEDIKMVVPVALVFKIKTRDRGPIQGTIVDKTGVTQVTVPQSNMEQGVPQAVEEMGVGFTLQRGTMPSVIVMINLGKTKVCSRT